MLVTICAKYGKNSIRTVRAGEHIEHTRQDVPYSSSFIAKFWLNDLEDIGQGQMLLHATHHLMLVMICGKYKKNPSRTVCTVERTQDVSYFSSFIVKSWLNDLTDISQGQRSLCATHPLMLPITCAKYGMNLSRTVGVTEWTPNAGRTDGRTEWNQYTPQQLCCAVV